jgi:hypothetical protein
MTAAPSTEIQQLREFIKDGFNEIKGDINQLDSKIEQVREDIIRTRSTVKRY